MHPREVLCHLRTQQPPRTGDVTLHIGGAVTHVDHHAQVAAVGQPFFQGGRVHLGHWLEGVGQQVQMGCVSVGQVLWLHIFQHGHFPAHLRQPRRGEGSPHTIVVIHHQACTAHTHMVIGFLHQLTTWGADSVRPMPEGVFLGCAHIQQIGVACAVGLPLGQRVAVDALHTRAEQQGQGGGCRFAFVGVTHRAKASVGFVLQLEASQGPADGAVAQGAHRVGDACIDERLRTNDAACAARAIDHDAGGGAGCQ